MASRCKGNVKLARCTVWVSGSRHGKHARFVVLKTWGNLQFDVLFGRAGTVAPWASALYYKVANVTMKAKTIIELFICEFNEIACCNGCAVYKQVEPYGALARFDNSRSIGQSKSPDIIYVSDSIILHCSTLRLRRAQQPKARDAGNL
jgi:hypothetical protein